MSTEPDAAAQQNVDQQLRRLLDSFSALLHQQRTVDTTHGTPQDSTDGQVASGRPRVAFCQARTPSVTRS
jgi:hypothetical protein